MENSNRIIYKENNTILKSVSINDNNILCVGGQDFLKTYIIDIKENSIKQNYQFPMSKKISFKTLFSNKSQLFSTGINKNILGNKGFFDIIDFENNLIISQYNYDCQSILNFDQSTNNDRKENSTFNQGSCYNHISSKIIGDFRLTCHCFQGTTTNSSDTNTGSNGS